MRALLLALTWLTVSPAHAAETVDKVKVEHVISRGPYHMDIVWLPDGSKCIVTWDWTANATSPNSVAQTCHISDQNPK